MANPRVKMIIEDSDKNITQVFPGTDQYSVIGLETRLEEIEAIITKLKSKTGVK